MTFKGLAATALMTALVAIPAHAWAGDGPKPMLHGNYCGPGNNAPLPPMDSLDAACARHDACTPDDGLASKGCNLRLQAEAEGVAQDPRQPADLRTMAGMVASGAAMMPSAPASGTVAPVGSGLPEAPTLASPADGAGDGMGEDEPPG